jgi:hypothetical protein
MARVKITKAAEQHTIRVSNTSVHQDLPIDGEFHEIHDDLLPVLADSDAEFEIENADATGGTAAAGGAAQAGGSGRAATRRKAPAKKPAKRKR